MKWNFAEPISCRFKNLTSWGVPEKFSISLCLDDFLLFDSKLHVVRKFLWGKRLKRLMSNLIDYLYKSNFQIKRHFFLNTDYEHFSKWLYDTYKTQLTTSVRLEITLSLLVFAPLYTISVNVRKNTSNRKLIQNTI